jgi:hypothetical protein
MTYRELAAEAVAEKDYEGFLSELKQALTDGRTNPNEVVRDTLLHATSRPSRSITLT